MSKHPIPDILKAFHEVVVFISRRGRGLTEKLGTFLESEELFLLLNLAAKLLFRRHICHILRGIELVAVVQDRIFRDGIVGVSTKQNANRRLGVQVKLCTSSCKISQSRNII